MANLLPYPWQMDAWQQLMQQQEQERLPHAILIQGERGIGKQRLAHSLAHYLLCQHPKDFACGQCKTCLLLEADTHPDFISLGLEEKSKQIKIDQVRKVVDFVGKTSQMQGMKVIVIEPSEAMNINAANALLKSLEEPTQKTLIILISHAPKRLLPTIRSRCQTLQLYKPERAAADAWLATFLQDISVRQQLLDLANGNPLLALSYHESELLGLYKRLLDQRISYKSGSGDALRFAQQLSEANLLDVLQLQQQLLWLLIKASMHGLSLEQSPLQVLAPIFEASGFSEKAFKLLAEIQEANQQVQGVTNPNPLLLLEALEIRWQALLRLRR